MATSWSFAGSCLKHLSGKQWETCIRWNQISDKDPRNLELFVAEAGDAGVFAPLLTPYGKRLVGIVILCLEAASLAKMPTMLAQNDQNTGNLILPKADGISMGWICP